MRSNTTIGSENKNNMKEEYEYLPDWAIIINENDTN